MDWHGFRPALPPHTTAPIASAVARAADFTFSFLPSPTPYTLLPDPGCWCVRSIRDGRVLLDRGHKRDYGLVLFPELVVCDPLHRRYHLLPPIPDDLAASVRDALHLTYQRSCEVILVPPGKEVDKEEYETSFRVIWMAQCKTKVVAFFYSSTTGQWQSIASKAWSDLLVCGMPIVSLKYRLFYRSHYAYGCLYWPMTNGIEFGLKNRPREAMLMLDTMTMEFSVADYPPGRWRGFQVGIVEAGEGRLGLLTFSINEAASQLRYMVRQNTDGSNNEWQLEKIIPLGSGNHSIVASTERYLLLLRLDFGTDHSEGLSLDVKTFQLERVCELSDVTSRSIYTSFPPSLSSRTV
ncbi:hypothetical protein CFC21_105160 [Triticum aestivum]|uniref:Uncharacterized protein n=3 Tax=Triticum TaxID=4564 RepID=A0A9R1AAN6_TRITD|nr:hypothetical protein CFC21_105160 [Triticum aestivum]VAI92649.1 unnamed protein product [Triticum turgidum subsp. durum]